MAQKDRFYAQDAMSEAVEGADLILYGVSESYKERCVFVRLVGMHVHCLC